MVSIGDKLDNKYLVVGRLGSGGFGEVFLADDEAIPGRQLALKILSSGSFATHDDLIWEMRALAKLDLPGVVRFFHHLSHKKQVVLVMEYCAGGSLSDRLSAAGRIAQVDVFRWGAVLCDTLALVHEKGIVHHDIKPANILFALDGAIKLGDFGVANRNTGTLLYLPPEMLQGGFATKTDPRVDVYALGLTLLEMLTGEHPFESTASGDALKARIAHDFVPEDIPRWVQEILLRATHPTPELRFQTMGDFREAIEGKHVPYIFDSTRIKAHRLAEKSEAALVRRKWKQAEKLADQALRIGPDSSAALVAAGRCQLLIRRIEKAKDYFGRALSINPRTHVQKELGWLNLEEGHLPIAISLLSDHLDRNPVDFEAYNLLLKCFFLSGRYEAGEDLAAQMMAETTANDCFRNNRFLCRLLNDGYSEYALDEIDGGSIVKRFIGHNLAVAREKPCSWNGGGAPSLRDKLIFQEFRFGLALNSRKTNAVSIRLPDGERREISEPLISFGYLEANDIRLTDRSISRRHAVLVNFPDEVWLYDLGSTCGTQLDGREVSGRVFLDGVHHVVLGRTNMEIGARADLLV